MTQMLNKGDTYNVPNREGLVVIARDGGLLAYLIDGKEKGILGTPGEILVGRPLDLKTLGARADGSACAACPARRRSASVTVDGRIAG